ncbi:wings apart-like protein regulation of heterochromatin-domain-containing protein, partial [Peziza echinospora]
MEDVQRKRRAPVTYGKLLSNRKRISEYAEFAEASQSPAVLRNTTNDVYDVPMEDMSSLAGPDGGIRSSSLSNMVTFHGSRTNKVNKNKDAQTQPARTDSTNNGKHRPHSQKSATLPALSSRREKSSGSKEMGVFDVPSSDDDNEGSNTVRTIRRTLSNSRKLKEGRDSSSSKGKEIKGSRPEGRISKEKGTKPVLHRPLSQDAVPKKMAAVEWHGTLQEPSSTAPTRGQVPSRSTQSTETEPRKIASIFRPKPQLHQQQVASKPTIPHTAPSVTEKPKFTVSINKKLPDPPKPLARAKSVQAEQAPKTSTKAPILGFKEDKMEVQKREEAKQRQKKTAVSATREETLPPKPKRVEERLPRPKTAVAATKEDDLTPKPKRVEEKISRPKTPSRQATAGIDSLYISSPILAPAGNFQKPTSKPTTQFSERSKWDEILEEDSESDVPAISRKPSMKRSREVDSPSQDADMEEISPRRRRMLEILEPDGLAPYRLAKSTEDLMDVDSSSESDDSDLEPTNSQSLIGLYTQPERIEPEDLSQNLSLASTAPAAPVFNPKTSRVTYARQRSFLPEVVKPDQDPFADPLLFPTLGRGLKGQKPVEEEEEEPEPGMMKSLHELREAGVNKRFLDNVEGYFEDIEGNVSLSQKRAGYLELATKLRDKTFVHKFRANNFDQRLLTGLEKQCDEIVRFALAFIAWTFLHDDKSSQITQLLLDNKIITMLDSMLDSTRDIKAITKDRRTNMSKAAQSLVADFSVVVQGSSIFGTSQPKIMSPQVLALGVLESFMRNLRQAGWFNNCLPIPIIRKLIKTIEPFTTTPLEKKDSLDPLFIELPTSILESHSIGRESGLDSDLSDSEITILANLLEGIIEMENDRFNNVQLLILRLTINITNHQPQICDVFCKTSLISSLVKVTQAKFEALSGQLEEEKRLLSLDILILSLALMINFAEMSDTARSTFMDVGSTNSPYITNLLTLFLNRLERAAEADSMEESQSNVGFGYLSILLAHLCQNTIIRNLVRSKLPKNSLEPLVSAVQEFVAHHRKVDAHMDDEDGDTAHKEFTERLELVATKLKSIEGM